MICSLQVFEVGTKIVDLCYEASMTSFGEVNQL